jgi:hypothetical protein
LPEVAKGQFTGHTIGNVHIRVYPDDTKRHRMPHFHAASPDGDMVVSLPALQVIVGW